MKKWLEGIAALSFGLGIGAGVIHGYATMGTIFFVVAGGLWLYVNIAFKEPEGEEIETEGRGV